MSRQSLISNLAAHKNKLFSVFSILILIASIFTLYKSNSPKKVQAAEAQCFSFAGGKMSVTQMEEMLVILQTHTQDPMYGEQLANVLAQIPILIEILKNPIIIGDPANLPEVPAFEVCEYVPGVTPTLLDCISLDCLPPIFPTLPCLPQICITPTNTPMPTSTPTLIATPTTVLKTSTPTPTIRGGAGSIVVPTTTATPTAKPSAQVLGATLPNTGTGRFWTIVLTLSTISGFALASYDRLRSIL